MTTAWCLWHCFYSLCPSHAICPSYVLNLSLRHHWNYLYHVHFVAIPINTCTVEFMRSVVEVCQMLCCSLLNRKWNCQYTTISISHFHINTQTKQKGYTIHTLYYQKVSESPIWPGSAGPLLALLIHNTHVPPSAIGIILEEWSARKFSSSVTLSSEEARLDHSHANTTWSWAPPTPCARTHIPLTH